ncbi:hypothetical protein F4775DRAFT_355389 [Biscogniauxia sp. FL1348]|nr:hypothetical protein F4775DRAFT_355389 [Biscogniauxia sp. FL1348]
MAEPKKKGFLSGLFRSSSRSISKSSPSRNAGRDHSRRASESDIHSRRRRPEPLEHATSTRRRPRRPDPHNAKGKGREQPNGHSYEDVPLLQWPPPGISMEADLTYSQAIDFINKGVPLYKGHKLPIALASDHHYGLYTTTVGNYGDESDAANLHDSMTQLTTLRIQGSGLPVYPWETLEQPSLAFGTGRRSGTITLNAWVGQFRNAPLTIALRDPGVVPRDADLTLIFSRLKDLEYGLEDDSEEQLYRLYKRFLKDPDKLFSPHKRMEQQITDLIMYLSSPNWIDLTNPKNQVVTRFIYDTSPANHDQYLKFFYQLLLSLELDLRINSRIHLEEARGKLMAQIPPQVQWNLALARRWRDNVRVEDYGPTAEQVRLRYKLRKRQVKMLKRFAQMMKWPNLDATIDALKQGDADNSLLSISSHTMAFFSGLVLPGSTFPFLIMNSLIDIDPDKATDDLALLTHLHPYCGFQYRNSYTYWTSACIVGKVLGPTCREVGGWIGPARPTSDLARSQIARIRSRRSRHRMTPEDVTSMAERSEPLGPPAESYPVTEYELFTPDTEDVADTVRIELLNLKALPDRQDHTGPKWFDASIQFAIDGVSWPLYLSYDVSFINAWPCSDGPHPLFFDYVHETTRASEVVNILDWGKPGSFEKIPHSSPEENGQLPRAHGNPSDDAERVLVIQAFGVRDNEVLARAWCSHWGLDALVADIGKTCMACAIREAYAATLTVVILTEDQPGGAD